MAVFTDFQNILPSPTQSIDYSGGTTQTGTATGPGYASVKLSSNSPTMTSKTNSGRLLSRAVGAHNWSIDISYNPMTRAEFEPIYAFLIEKRGMLSPFYVELPQYAAPRDTTFAASGFSDTLSGDAGSAGDSILDSVTAVSYDVSVDKTPIPGDLFNIADSSDSNHKKTYMVTRVETNSDYLSSRGQPATEELRISFTPGLQRATDASATLTFTSPKIKVILDKSIQEYSLGVDNLYNFSLKLKEVQ